MQIKPQKSGLKPYLASSDIIDFDKENCFGIIELADNLEKKSSNKIDFIKNAYEYVRDEISHSADINEDAITCSASEVLKEKHGICFAKSHLLAALLRCKGIPTGFCYQKLILDDETAPVLIFHGLNGVYIAEYDYWIRLDARGNKDGVNAEFSLQKEKLAFPVRSEKGELDVPIVFSEPDPKIIAALARNQTRTELWADLPTELESHIEYTDSLSATEYLELRECVGWPAFPKEQAEQGLNGTTYMVVGRDNGKAVSLARVQWDGGYIALIVDVIVHPDYQKNDIGRTMINMLMEYLKGNLKPGWKIMISLMAAIGKEPFYEKFDFIRRPNDNFGCGMFQWIEKE